MDSAWTGKHASMQHNPLQAFVSVQLTEKQAQFSIEGKGPNETRGSHHTSMGKSKNLISLKVLRIFC